MAKSDTTANSYTVSYAQGNASNTTNLPSTQTSVNTTKYTANGWTKTSGSTTRNYANGAATGALSANLTLYPCFSQSTTNGGVTTSSNVMSKSNTTSNGYKVTYAQGTATSTTVPSAQTATDTTSYTHNGWATSASGSKAYGRGAATGALSANLTLYPYFDSSLSRGSVTLATNSMTKSNTNDYSYTVTYNANNGSVSPTSATATKVRSYTANGWTTTSGGTSKTHSNGASHQVTANITLYPCFTQSTSGGSVTLPTPTRTGYTFNGWYTAATGGTKVGNAGATYTPSAAITLYAQWTAITYSVKYNGNGSTTGSMSDSSHTYDVAKALTANAFSRAYTVTYNANGGSVSSTSATATATFKGWNTSSSATSATYTDKQSVSNLSSTSGATVNLYAIWTLGSVTLPTPTRTGYTFKGWSTSSSATSGSTGSYTPTGNVTLYATWQANTYSVTYNANGGSGAPSATSYTYASSGTVTLSSTKPTRAGYTFKGWGSSTSDTSVDYAAGAAYPKNVASNKTLYAIWDYIGVIRIGSNKYLPYAYINGVWQRLMPYVYDTSTSKWKETGSNS